MKYIATISGGKDSVTMVDLLLKNDYPVDYIVFNDTKLEFKMMYDYIDKLNEYFKNRYNKEIIKTEPDIEFKDLILRDRTRGERKGKTKGFLSPEMPFCDFRKYSKINPLQKWLKKNNIKDYILYIGFTKDEIARADNFRKNNPNTIFPLIEYFNMSELDCKKYLIEQEMENPLYRYFSRTGCKFCHYQSEQDWYHIWKYFNKDWQELKELEKKVMRSNADNKYIFSNFKNTDDMEKLFIQKEKQGSLFDFSDEPIKDCFCKI